MDTEDTQEVATSGNDLREALSAAWPTTEVATTDQNVSAETKAEDKMAARDEKGKFVAATETIKAKTPPDVKVKGPIVTKKGEVATAGTEVKAEVGAETKAAEVPKPEYKAPQSWKPAVREKWATLPPEVQQEVVRLDREVRQVMQTAAQKGKDWDTFDQMVTPYKALLGGQHPVQAAANLFQNAAALYAGPPAQKAQIVANMIKSFGVDIATLDQLLAGQAPANQPAPYNDPRVDQLLQELQNQKQQRAETLMRGGQQDVMSFAEGKEFMDDLAPYMADLLEVAAKNGVTLTLDDAYNRAKLLHPDIAQIEQQRAMSQQVTVAQTNVQKAKAAASSVKSAPVGAVGPGEPDTLRGQLEAAWGKNLGR